MIDHTNDNLSNSPMEAASLVLKAIPPGVKLSREGLRNVFNMVHKRPPTQTELDHMVTHRPQIGEAFLGGFLTPKIDKYTGMRTDGKPLFNPDNPNTPDFLTGDKQVSDEARLFAVNNLKPNSSYLKKLVSHLSDRLSGNADYSKTPKNDIAAMYTMGFSIRPLLRDLVKAHLQQAFTQHLIKRNSQLNDKQFFIDVKHLDNLVTEYSLPAHLRRYIK